jgi:hypothetical protein
MEMEKQVLIEFLKAHGDGGLGAKIVYDNPSYGESVLTINSVPVCGDEAISFLDVKGVAQSISYTAIKKVMP